MDEILNRRARPISANWATENNLYDKENLIVAVEMSNKSGSHEEINKILNDKRITLSKL